MIDAPSIVRRIHLKLKKTNKEDTINSVIQWTGSFYLVAMYCIMSFFPEKYPLNILMGLLGGMCFLTWSIRVKNYPQSIVNTTGVLVCIAGIVKYFLSH